MKQAYMNDSLLVLVLTDVRLRAIIGLYTIISDGQGLKFTSNVYI